MLYILERWTKVDYDETRAVVVRATCESEARLIARENCYPSTDIWGNPELVSCSILSHDGPSEVVLADFKAG